MKIRSAVLTAFSIAAATVVVAVAPAAHASTINNTVGNSGIRVTGDGIRVNDVNSDGIRVNSVTGDGIRVNSVKSAGIRVNFAARARNAGLSSSQASALQAKVNSYLAKTGGTQIAANKIDVGGGVLVLTVPGESHVRDLSATTTASGASTFAPQYSCAYYHFCAFDQTGWAGNVLDWYTCGEYGMPYFSVGSFEDHQSWGTVSTINTTTGSFNITAQLDDIDIDWAPVLSIKIC